MATSSVAELVEVWDEGRLNWLDLFQHLLSLIDSSSVDAVVDHLPDSIRAEFVQQLHDWYGGSPKDFVSIDGGLFIETDAERRARHEVQMAHFMAVTLPAIRDWLARNGYSVEP